MVHLLVIRKIALRHFSVNRFLRKKEKDIQRSSFGVRRPNERAERTKQGKKKRWEG
jgi:hypothetical protein